MTLTLTCTPFVRVGEYATCIAGTAPEGQTIQVREWFAVSKASGATAQICTGAGTQCTTPILEPVTIYVRALVGGYEQTKNAPIIVKPPKLMLDKSPTESVVAAGTSISYTATTSSTASIQTRLWRFIGIDGEIVDNACVAGANPCVRPLTEGGYMSVTALVDGFNDEANTSITFVGTRCTRDSVQCPGLGDEIDALKAPTQPQLCKDMAAVLEEALAGPGIWKIEGPTFFEGWNPDGKIHIKELYFGSNRSELRGLLAHEAAHKNYHHSGDPLAGETTVENIQNLCK